MKRSLKVTLAPSTCSIRSRCAMHVRLHLLLVSAIKSCFYTSIKGPFSSTPLFAPHQSLHQGRVSAPMCQVSICTIKNSAFKRDFSHGLPYVLFSVTLEKTQKWLQRYYFTVKYTGAQQRADWSNGSVSIAPLWGIKFAQGQ